MIFTAPRLAAVAIAAQVRHHDKIVPHQSRRDVAPEHVRLGNAVQQKQQRAVAVAAVNGIDGRVGGLDKLRAKILEERRRQFSPRVVSVSGILHLRRSLFISMPDPSRTHAGTRKSDRCSNCEAAVDDQRD
jgi:hypothetical protein